MRRFSIPLLSVILLLAVSCTPAGDNEALRSGSVAVIDKLSVSGNEMITLTGLEGGSFYTLYTSSGDSGIRK